jgi:phosphoribosylformylglycinamidine synthase
MDFKQAGDLIYVVGDTRDELGGSHLALVNNLAGGKVPAVDPDTARRTFAAVHQAIGRGVVRACHDLSEGGLAVAAAEMAFAGGLGAWIGLDGVPSDLWSDMDEAALEPVLMFSESNSRFLCEISAQDAAEFERALEGIPFGRIGEVRDDAKLQIYGNSSSRPLIDARINDLKEAWQAPFRW